MFTIPCIVAKPGIPLISANDYALLVERACKSHLVNISIIALKGDSDKENDALEEPAPKSTKRCDPARSLATLGKLRISRLCKSIGNVPRRPRRASLRTATLMITVHTFHLAMSNLSVGHRLWYVSGRLFALDQSLMFASLL
jgi:hypothetical protein